MSSRHIFLANDVKRTLALYMYEASRRYEGAFIRVRLRVYEREREREREREHVKDGMREHRRTDKARIVQESGTESLIFVKHERNAAIAAYEKCIVRDYRVVHLLLLCLWASKRARKWLP